MNWPLGAVSGLHEGYRVRDSGGGKQKGRQRKVKLGMRGREGGGRLDGT